MKGPIPAAGPPEDFVSQEDEGLFVSADEHKIVAALISQHALQPLGVWPDTAPQSPRKAPRRTAASFV